MPWGSGNTELSNHFEEGRGGEKLIYITVSFLIEAVEQVTTLISRWRSVLATIRERPCGLALRTGPQRPCELALGAGQQRLCESWRRAWHMFGKWIFQKGTYYSKGRS